MIEGLKQLFAPNYCTVCGQPAYSGAIFCTRCTYEMPRTRYHHLRDNKTTDKLAGRFDFEKATSLFYYRKGSFYSRPIFSLKYHGRKYVGTELGRMLGYELDKSKFTEGIDAIIPVPLHPQKQRIRGYNQCSLIAKGLSEAARIPSIEGNLVRVTASESQTRKGREQRWTCLQEAFELKKPKSLEGKHILLIDDVITTGATIEACAIALATANGLKISVASIGLACD